MDTAWIQVFVLTIAECVAPEGKMICQEQEFELQFLSRRDCEIALEQLVALKEESATVIVDRDKSSCAPSASEREIFASLEEVTGASQGIDGWKPPGESTLQPSASRVAHEERLAKLPSCEDTKGQAPCKMGGIIVESATTGDSVDVWRRD